MCVWSGCSIKDNYEVLSFFFDGVPDPNAPPGTIFGGRSATYSSHEPFTEKRCTECHPSLFVPVQNGAEICMKCHAEKVDELPMMHGPVAARACLFCHQAHDSPYQSLLRDPPPQICMRCHDQFLLDTGKVEAHTDDTRSCLDCHGGHGGTRAYFLHDSVIEEMEEAAAAEQADDQSGAPDGGPDG